MSDEHMAYLVFLAAFLIWAVPKLDAWSDKKVKHAVAEALDEHHPEPDPIDAHFAEIPDECTPIGDAALLIAQTESYLRSAV